MMLERCLGVQDVFHPHVNTFRLPRAAQIVAFQATVTKVFRCLPYFGKRELF
jgi:hypothetical protein